MSRAIEDHALLSDCQTAALVATDGTLDWWPGPRFDSPSLFSALLDERAGHWTIQPAGGFDVKRRYLPDTLVVETTMRTDSGVLRLRDALAFAPGSRKHDIGLEVPHAAVRVAEAVGGDVRLRVECVPRPDYGLAVPRLVETERGVESIGGAERIVLSGDRRLRAEGGRACAELTLHAGERVGWVLQRMRGALARTPAQMLDAHRTIEETVAAWRSWVELHRTYEGDYADQVQRAALVTQGLTYQPSGAVVAAPTTSLPEIIGGEANYDYRYGWVRDSAMIARALSLATCTDEACSYFEWITRAALTCRQDDRVQVLFGVDGERDVYEHALDHLRGHLDSRPVRVGNEAFRQRQLDVLGELVDCAWTVRNQLDAFDPFAAEFVRELVDRAAEHWREPDSGIWEGRDGERHHLFSKLMCWVALDRGIRLADQLGPAADVRRWSQVRQEIADAVLRRGWCASKRAFSGSFDSDQLDAAVLAMPIVGLVEPNDPRMSQTIDAVERELGDQGLLRRWTGAGDGAFMLVSFWLAECHALAGRLERAEEVFERACAHANDLGLFAEEVDPDTHRLLGNFPQAIAHIGLVNAAQTLTVARRRTSRGAVA